MDPRRAPSRRSSAAHDHARRATTFAQILAETINAARHKPRHLSGGECQSATGLRCALCYAGTLTYDQEVPLKQKALTAYWSRHLPDIPLDPLVPAPAGRSYRTVTKRRAFLSRGRVTIGLIDPSSLYGRLEPFEALRCSIEPDDHAHIYSAVREYLSTSRAQPIVPQVLYVVIKGAPTRWSVIMHVRTITHDLLRAVNSLSKILTRSGHGVTGVFLLEGDPTDERTPRYYLGESRGRARRKFRRIFGETHLTVEILGAPFSFSPLAFTQVNHPVFEELLLRARSLLGMERDQSLYDLYCGYGPFALSYAGFVARVIGVDASPEAITSAVTNARRQGVKNARFLHADITPITLRSILKGISQGDSVILDPPRGGTAPGVIEYIATKHVSMIAHLFCNIDLLPSEIARWSAQGYRTLQAIPFDMFPGTPEIETLVLLQPGR